MGSWENCACATGDKTNAAMTSAARRVAWKVTERFLLFGSIFRLRDIGFGGVRICGRLPFENVLGVCFQHLTVGEGDVQDTAAGFAVLERPQADGEFVAGLEG